MRKTLVRKSEKYVFTPLEVPETTYIPQKFPKKGPKKDESKEQQIIQSENQSQVILDEQEKLSKQSKQFETPFIPKLDIPHYVNKPPQFEPVNLRANQALLERNQEILNKKLAKDKKEKEEEPVQFMNWQNQCKKQDEEIRSKVIEERHNNLDKSRQRAKQVKKEIIKQKLQEGKELREELSQQIENAQNEIETEREIVRDTKHQMINYAPYIVEACKRNKRLETQQMKKELHLNIKKAKLEQEADIQKKKESATKIKHDVKNHIITRKDKYRDQVDITETKYLAQMTDKEVNEYLKHNKERKNQEVEEKIRDHREQKEAKMERLLKMLEEQEIQAREQERIHTARREEKIATARKAEEERKSKEDQQMLALEKKMQKKQEKRMKEAKDQDEQARMISARNHFLALNKKALQVKSFEDNIQGNFRAAKERQNQLSFQSKKKKLQPKQEPQLKNLNHILGLDHF